jgi:hypothetical protein
MHAIFINSTLTCNAIRFDQRTSTRFLSRQSPYLWFIASAIFSSMTLINDLQAGSVLSMSISLKPRHAIISPYRLVSAYQLPTLQYHCRPTVPHPTLLPCPCHLEIYLTLIHITPSSLHCPTTYPKYPTPLQAIDHLTTLLRPHHILLRL